MRALPCYLHLEPAVKILAATAKHLFPGPALNSCSANLSVKPSSDSGISFIPLNGKLSETESRIKLLLLDCQCLIKSVSHSHFIYFHFLLHSLLTL